METVKTDDFAGLLAALGRGVQPSQSSSNLNQTTSFHPSSQPAFSSFNYPPYMWQPPLQQPNPSYMMQQPLSMPPPQQLLVPQVLETKKSNFLVVGMLVTAVIIFGILAWMRSMRVVQEKEDESSDEEEPVYEAKKEVREVPPPSDLNEFVSSNLLKYVNDFKINNDYVDISGEDIPQAPPSPEIVKSMPKKRIVADESQEVLDYAKRRETLFDVLDYKKE